MKHTSTANWIRLSALPVVLGLFLVLGWVADAQSDAESSAPGTQATQKSLDQLKAKWRSVSPDELKRAAEAGNPEAEYCFGLVEMEKGREAVKAAFRHALQAEPQGPVFKWEEVLPRWKDVPRDELMKAVVGGNREAQYYFGRIGQDEGVRRERQGFTWVEKAAAKGLDHAQFDTGMNYSDRCGVVVVDKDLAVGLKWLRMAAEQGYEPATHQLADIQLEGLEGRPDFVIAIKLLWRCVDQKCHRAEYQLAMLYANGNGEPRHAGESPAALLEKARLGDVPLAHLELAKRYRNGFGVPKNLVRAARHYVIISLAEGYDWELQRAQEEVYALLTDDGKPKPNPDPETQRFAEYLAIQTRAIQAREPAAMLQMVQLELANANDERARTFGYFWLSRAQQSGLAAAGPALAQLEKTMSAAELERAKATIAAAAKQENSDRK